MHGKFMPSKLALERSFVFDTSAHLPFPTAVIRRYLLAAIHSGTNRRGHRVVVALAQKDWPGRSGRAEAQDLSSQPMGSASRSASAGPHEPFG
jgi:hypothetical protein